MPAPENSAADQPGGPSEGTTTEASDFLADGNGSSFPSDSAASETAPTQNADERGEQATETEAETGETAATEGDETETASQDDFLASLSPEEQAYYARRYPTLFAAYQDADQPADLRQAFVDRVNQDHEYQRLRDGEQEEGEATAETSQAAQTPEQQRQAYYAQVDNIVNTQIDQKAIEELGTTMAEVLVEMGGGDAKNLGEEDRAMVTKTASKLGKVLARGATDLLATLLPSLLQSRMEMVYPGLSRMYERTMYGEEWQEVNQSVLGGKGPVYGSPEFQQAIDKVVAEMPQLRSVVFRDKQGRPLPAREQTRQQYTLVAKMIAGQKVDPAAMTQAVQTGKKLARNADTTRAAGKALGGGQNVGSSAGKGNELRSWIMEHQAGTRFTPTKGS